MPRNREATAGERRPAMNVISAILGAHWAMEEQAIRTMLEIASRENLTPEAVAAQLGRPLDNTRAVTVRDGVAIVPVTGPLFRYADFFTEISGATTYADLGTDLGRVLDDRSIRAILLEIDSPGGEVNGLSQLAALVREAAGVKPVIAFISGTGASAAYWLAAAASSVVVSDTAVVGSIGVRASYRDTRALDDAKGIKTVEIVSSQSPNKRLDPTEDAGRAQLQRVMDDLAQVFVESVAEYRGVTPDVVLADFGQGGVFVGQAAVDAGLADDVGTFESTLAALREGADAAVATWRGAQPSARARAGTPAAPAATTTPPLTTDQPMKTKPTGPSAEGDNTTDDTKDPAACPECGGKMEDKKCTECGYVEDEPGAEADAEKKKAEEAKKASAQDGVVPIDAAAIRKQERERIAQIRTLGKNADAALVEKCIEEGVSADAAARVFLEAQQQSASTRLDQLRGDERAAKTPATNAGSGEGATVKDAAKAATAAFYAHSAPRTAATK